jgi:NADPH:quinone reductase-like Zn-dependent oxidoreductase
LIVASGGTALIDAVAGGIGSALVQLARAAGMRVIAIAAKRLELLRELVPAAAFAVLGNPGTPAREESRSKRSRA